MAAPQPESNVQLIQSLSRGLAVIRAFDADRPRQTLAQVAEVTGLPRATTRRFLHTLVAEGYALTDGSEFWLTPHVLGLGYSYLSSLGLPAIAQPHLQSASRLLDESCSAAVLDDGDVVYVARAAANRIMRENITIGTRFPAYAAALGRVLLAGLPQEQLEQYLTTSDFPPLTPKTVTDPEKLREILADVAEQGWCIVDQELEAGLRSVACPVLDERGNVVAAVNVSTQVAAYTYEEIVEKLLPSLQATARAISHDVRTAALN
ncbi:helix-turn-helix domain-containing protein [Corynebacterium sp. TA-R-1]|uniref:Helix-turn-helix domain-containing protein n=1 Tax=Corynebacterium stercoris TaxID=2943490 RepID=A0ABT1G0J2_9CORY|nr:IclR family transcriptional regulator C-terminal domain-containing protein [Corynebacterium stercoris]MCP1387531.1 helix-turn-helix domain-containing protein [Corynebacterium stercoris]